MTCNLMYIPFQLDVVRQNFLSRTKREQIVCIIIDHVAFSDDGGWLATVSYNRYCLMLNKEFRVQSLRLPMYTYSLIAFFLLISTRLREEMTRKMPWN